MTFNVRSIFSEKSKYRLYITMVAQEIISSDGECFLLSSAAHNTLSTNQPYVSRGCS